jgi:hypothetical protein
MLKPTGIRVATAVALTLAASAAHRTAAQVAPAGDCPRISFVYVANSSIFDLTDPNLEGRFGWAYRAANALHVRTREPVIRRELLFGPGDCFDEYMLEESERLLRNYDFLSRVDIFGVPQEDGSYHVIVDTRDEWSTQVDVRVRMNGSLALEGVRLQETNLLGSGQTLGAFYFERDVARTYGLSYFTPQLLRTRWDLRADVGRTRAGTLVRTEVAHPFVGEVGHWAARQSFLRDDRHFDYILAGETGNDGAHLLVPVREQFFDLALIRRTRTRGSATVLGAALSHQSLGYPGAVEFVPTGDYERREPADSLQIGRVSRQMTPLRNIRIFGIVGQRNIWWVKRRGFDSLRGQQDVALGAEALLALGRSVQALETDDDLYLTASLYSGFEAGSLLLITRGHLDSRRNLDAPSGEAEWEDVFGEAEAFAYLRHHRIPGQTLFLRAAAAGAWNTRTPFQLTLGGERALRGYSPYQLPGGRRLVLNAENRVDLGWPLPQMFDLGVTVFADVGRVWPGDAPFGIASGWRAAAGAGLRGAFPAGSRTTYRIDVAWPVGGATRLGDARLLLSIGEILGIADQTGDLQFLRSRPERVAGNLLRLR